MNSEFKLKHIELEQVVLENDGGARWDLTVEIGGLEGEDYKIGILIDEFEEGKSVARKLIALGNWVRHTIDKAEN